MFLRNMGKWMTGRKGALTTYYPEEKRADYGASNRGKHILTQRPDGSPQCVACNMCATVCPAKVIEIEAAFDPDDPAHPKYPTRFEIDYSRCVFCGHVRRGLSRGRDPHGEGVPDFPSRDRMRMWLGREELLHLEARRTWRTSGARPSSRRQEARRAGSAATRRRPTHASGGSCHDLVLTHLDDILLVVFGVSALVGGVLVILLRQPMRVAMALISTMVFLGGIYGLLGVHFIAAFQVLIYVGAVMVFMVYVIMLLDTRDPAQATRFSSLVDAGRRRLRALPRGLVYG